MTDTEAVKMSDGAHRLGDLLAIIATAIDGLPALHQSRLLDATRALLDINARLNRTAPDQRNRRRPRRAQRYERGKWRTQ